MNATMPLNATNLTCFFLAVFWEQTSLEAIASIIACVLSSVFARTAVVGNGIIMIAIWRTRQLHSPSHTLLFCLALSDFIVGLVAQPSFVAFKIAELVNNFNVYCHLRITQFFFGWITCGVSFVCLSGICIDRLLALTLHLRYRNVIAVPRMVTAVISVWIAISIGAVSKFWISDDRWLFLPAMIFSLTTLITSFCTFKIFKTTRRHQRQIHQQIETIKARSCTVDVLKCKKSTVTVLCVFGLFLVFYIPFVAVMISQAVNGVTRSVKLAYDLATTAVFVNSSVNPFIYCLRMEQLRRAVRRNFKVRF